MQSLLGVAEVMSKNGPISVLELEKYDYILLYFSAAWCPPCQAFTPQLAKFYEIHKSAKNFEIVFISRDKTAEEFGKYYEHHPWLALHGSQVTDPLASAMKIDGIPTIINVDPKTGQVVSRNGRMAVVADPEAEGFPWSPSLRTTLYANEVNGKNGNKVSVEEISAKNDYVFLYFSAGWCGPCQAFTPKLAEFYEANKEAKKFEIIFISLDRSEEDFQKYYEHHPWLAFYGDKVKMLASMFRIQGIPALYLLDAKTGEIIRSQVNDNVINDPKAEKFPWPITLQNVLGVDHVTSKADKQVSVSDLVANNDYIMLYFSAGWCGPCQAFTPKLAEFYEANKEAKRFEIIFISLDRSEEDFQKYYEHHPWLALYGPSVQDSAQAMGIEGIPTLAVFDKSGKLVTQDGVENVIEDEDGFPWAK